MTGHTPFRDLKHKVPATPDRLTAEHEQEIRDRMREYPREWGPVCVGCGADEYRIDGFCSRECRDYHTDEDVADLLAELDAVRRDHAQAIEQIERQRERAKRRESLLVGAYADGMYDGCDYALDVLRGVEGA